MQAFLGELVYILGRDEIRAPLKTPAYEAIFGENVPHLRISATDSKLRNISCTQFIKNSATAKSYNEAFIGWVKMQSGFSFQTV